MSDEPLWAFELRPEYNLEDLNGATVAFGPAAVTYDIKAALEESGGTIVTNDSLLAGTLRGHHILQEVSPEAGSEPVETPVSEITTSEEPHPSAFADDVPAEHADEPDDEDAAVSQGEEVAGEDTPARW